MTSRIGVRLCSIMVVTLIVSGCDVVGLATHPPTFQPGSEQLPGPGLAIITGDPSKALSSLRLEYVLPDGSIVPARETINAGDEIMATTWSNPGDLQVIVNSRRCSGAFTIASDQQTKVLLRIRPEGCETVVQETGPLSS